MDFQIETFVIEIMSYVIFLRPTKAIKRNENDSISLRISRVMDAEGIPHCSNGSVIEVRYRDAFWHPVKSMLRH